MKQKKSVPYRKFTSLFISLLISQSAWTSTDLQKRMNVPATDRKSLAKKYDLTRLWTFENSKNFQDDIVMGDGSEQGSKLINRETNLSAVSCENRSYAYFNKGMINSDETLVIEDILKDVKLTTLEDTLVTAKKGWDFVHRNFPNVTPSSEKFNPNFDAKIKASVAIPSRRKEILQSTSLLEVKQRNHGSLYEINSSDYTIGGWFKPTKSKNSNQQMTLLTKRFAKAHDFSSSLEWKLFFSGNILYFQSFHDPETEATSHYLTVEQAMQFRNQPKNIPYYSVSDYYADVLEKPVFGKIKSAPPIALSRIFLDTPAELPSSKKPISSPGTSPITPPSSPTVPEIPPGPVPFPPTPYPPIVVPPDHNGKQHIADFDMKNFWWASTLGSCYGCEKDDQHRDAWYYLSISVHLNDPLGPYLDLTMILDPNEKIFGTKATMASNVKTARWELNRSQSSYIPSNPILNSAKIEKGCTKSTCVESTLEVGNIEQNEGYTGFMRGVYITKKALKSNDVLDLAAQFYPNDSEQCTYLQKGQ